MSQIRDFVSYFRVPYLEFPLYSYALTHDETFKVTEYESDSKKNYIQEYNTSKGTSSNKDYASNVSEYTIKDDGEYTAYEPTKEERICCGNSLFSFCFVNFQLHIL